MVYNARFSFICHTIMSQQEPHASTHNAPSELIYGINDKPKPLVAFFAALQHLLAILVPIVTPGYLICKALGVSEVDTNLI